MVKTETLCWLIVSTKGGIHSDVVTTSFSIATICSPDSV